MLAYKEQQALEALLVCGTRKEAAMMAGITEKTLRKYINDAEFQREYKAFYRGKLKEGKDEIARFDDLVTAGLCLRFLKGSMVMKPDYEIAKDALTMWDVANLPDPDDTI